MKRTMMGAAALALVTALGGCAATADVRPAAQAAAPAFKSDRISVEARGRPGGPDVVLIPGLSSTREVWDRTVAALEPTYRLHLVQVNGFGGTPAGANAQGPLLDPLVAEVARYMREQGLKRPAIIGHSMGGETALLLAAGHPEAVSRVMAVDALPFFALLMNPAATPESVRPQADAVRDATLRMTPEQYRAGAPAALAGLVKNPEARVRHAAVSGASDPRVVAQFTHELILRDIRPDLARNTVPITVLHAFDSDFGVPQAVFDKVWTDAYAGLPNVKLVRVDGSRHFIMDDQPERFAREVDAFLAGSDGR